MDTLLRGALFWTPYILVPELLAAFVPRWPLPTLSGTVWAIIAAWPPETLFVALAMFALGGHFESQWPVRYFVLAVLAVFVSLGIHLLLR